MCCCLWWCLLNSKFTYLLCCYKSEFHWSFSGHLSFRDWQKYSPSPVINKSNGNVRAMTSVTLYHLLSIHYISHTLPSPNLFKLRILLIKASSLGHNCQVYPLPSLWTELKHLLSFHLLPTSLTSEEYFIWLLRHLHPCGPRYLLKQLRIFVFWGMSTF